MANRNKAEVEQNAARITNWLLSSRAEFEQQGAAEDAAITGASIANRDDGLTAIDHLENREVVVRDMVAGTKPARFVLKPGRDWPETCAKLLAAQSAGQSK